MMKTFDSLKYSHKQQGTYVLYRHRVLRHEVQVFYRRCNLRELCHCSVAVRIEDLIILFDICSRGYLQVWPLNTLTGEVIAEKDLPDGIKLLSLDEGRSYEVTRLKTTQGSYSLSIVSDILSIWHPPQSGTLPQLHQNYGQQHWRGQHRGPLWNLRQEPGKWVHVPRWAGSL